MQAEHSNQRHRCARARVERDVPDFSEWDAREERNRGDGPARADAHAGHESILIRTEILDRRHCVQGERRVGPGAFRGVHQFWAPRVEYLETFVIQFAESLLTLRQGKKAAASVPDPAALADMFVELE